MRDPTDRLRNAASALLWAVTLLVCVFLFDMFSETIYNYWYRN